MKKLDSVSKRIVVVGMVVCAILLSASLLVFSVANIQKTQASTNATFQNTHATPAAGEIMCAPIIRSTQDVQYIFWNTTTGKSVIYWWGATEQKYVKSLETNQLPANPFE